MSKSLNHHQLIGYFGSDPRYRELDSGTVVNFSLATHESWKDKISGDKKERTDWHNVVCYDQLAKIAKEHLKKGSKVYLAGRVQTRKWMDEANTERYTTETIVQDLIMLGSSSVVAEE